MHRTSTMKEMKYFITATCQKCHFKIKFWNTDLEVNQPSKQGCECEWRIDDYEIKEWNFEF